jgi:acetylglutamate kinase
VTTRQTGARSGTPRVPDAIAADLIVVKLGGTTIAGQEHVLGKVAELSHERPVVVVHGGGKRVTSWLERLGVPTRFEEGLRVTDVDSLEVTAAVLRGVVNTEVVAALRARGCDAVGLSGVDGGIVVAQRLTGKGLVATATGARDGLLRLLLATGRVPVVAPLALDENGVVCNVNADDVAAGLARGLGARQLVLLTDVDGIRGADGQRLPHLATDEAERLIGSGVIAGGMIPKVRTALRAVGDDPDAEAIVVDSSDPDALGRALGDPQFGTRLRAAAQPSTPSAMSGVGPTPGA